MSKKITSKPIAPKENEEEVEEKEEIKEEKVKKEEKEVKKDTVKDKEPKKPTRKRAKSIDIDPNELVAVRSVTKGLLIYKSNRTGQVIRWNDFDDVEYIEFGELITMRSSSPKFINEPYLVIDDEEVVESLGLTELYERMIDIDNLYDFFEQSVEEMAKQIEQMPKGSKNLISNTAHDMIKDGELYDIRKIKLLEEELGVGLQMSMD